MSYKDELTIDKHNLDVEWINQSKVFAEWGEELVYAQERTDKAKANLDLIKAQIDSKIRANNIGGKTTESQILNMIIQDSEYQKAIVEHIEAKKQEGIIEIARKAFEFQRNKALDRLTDLFLSNYWAEPRGKAEQMISQNLERQHEKVLNENQRLARREK